MTNANDPNNKSLVERRKIGGSSLHQRVAAQPLPPKPSSITAQAPGQNLPDLAASLANRIGLMLDVSGSMNGEEHGKRKIQHLKDACQSFLQSCDFSNTSIAIETFPGDSEEDDLCGGLVHSFEGNDDPLAHLLPKAPPKSKKRLRVLSNVHALLSARIDQEQSRGGTPMHEAMKDVLNLYPITRGIIVSDGEADSSCDAFACACDWKAADLQIDTVHIGHSSGGENTLREIARITGGLYIKFDNVENFAKNFKFLAPAYRAMLTSGSANLLGAKEVK